MEQHRSPTGSLVPPLLSPESPWHNFARRDAYTYIMTDLPRGDRRAFWDSGEKTVATELLPVIEEFAVPRSTALEIGCGVGRLAVPMAQHFQQVFGLDVSDEMVSQAAANARERQLSNARFVSISELRNSAGDSLRFDARVDFIYSLLVFQHIEDFRIIQEYLRRVSSWLGEDGIAYLQFDTRPRTVLYGIRNAIPDSLLPRHLRRGIRRIRRIPAELETTFEAAGLLCVRSIGKNTEYHRYVLRRKLNGAQGDRSASEMPSAVIRD